MTIDCVTTSIDFIRHGEPVGGKRYRGHQDDPLTQNGWRQMQRALAGENIWDAILSSPLKRCYDFAEHLSQQHSIALIKEPRLMEISFGEWEGETAEGILQTDAERLHQFWSDPFKYTPPGAESLEKFMQRTMAAWSDIQTTWLGQHILIICHAGAMRMILCHILGMPVVNQFSVQLDYASVMRIRIEGEGETALTRLESLTGSTP